MKSIVPSSSAFLISRVTLPLINTLPSISKFEPSVLESSILPLSVIPSAPSRVTAPISSPEPIAPIVIVSPASVPEPLACESALRVRLLSVLEPITELIEIGAPRVLIVKF